MKKLILASGSPRRKELLSKIGLEFEVIPSNYEENLPDDIFTYEKIETLALNKAKEVLSRVNEDAIIISADTVVVLNNKILGKPHSKSEAFNMISSLSNNTHEVITAIAMIDVSTQKTIVHSKSTKVTFRKIEPNEVEKYISTNEPYDKAGAYAAQGLASVFIEKIDGCFNNVVGISTFEVDKMLKEIM
ncbi:MAG: Maf family protein [Candidatus Gastranaerophilales bacterium]|nr:Maf family protein [Candidatus Gastranaerophilales bacterium]